MLRQLDFINVCYEVILTDYEEQVERRSTSSERATVMTTVVMKLKNFSSRKDITRGLLMHIYAQFEGRLCRAVSESKQQRHFKQLNCQQLRARYLKH